MIRKITTVALIAFVGFSSATLVSFKPCDGTTYSGKIDTIDINPFPIQRGQNVSITVTADTPVTVQAGDFEAVVTALGVKALDIKESFCKYTACPIQPGKVTLTVTEAVSAFAPPVDVQIRVSGTDNKGSSLFCELVDAKIKFFDEQVKVQYENDY